MTFDQFLQGLLTSSPYWAPFLAALAMVLTFMRYLIKVLVSNGLTQAVNKLADKLDAMPDKVGSAVAFKILEHQSKQ